MKLLLLFGNVVVGEIADAFDHQGTQFGDFECSLPADGNKTAKRRRGAMTIAADEALRIAQADAIKAYHDLSIYCVRLVLEDDGWHVDYDLKNPQFKGGGPHYVIDPVSGVIQFKRYDQ